MYSQKINIKSKGNAVSKRALLIIELVAVLLWLILFALLIEFMPLSLVWTKIIIWTITIAFLCIALIYLPIYYKTLRYEVTNDLVRYEKGFIVRKKSYMKREKIVFVTLLKTPLTPIFGISSLTISATGSSITIPFLDTKKANQLAKELSPRTDF